jgi:hypothetical protein
MAVPSLAAAAHGLRRADTWRGVESPALVSLMAAGEHRGWPASGGMTTGWRQAPSLPESAAVAPIRGSSPARASRPRHRMLCASAGSCGGAVRVVWQRVRIWVWRVWVSGGVACGGAL